MVDWADSENLLEDYFDSDFIGLTEMLLYVKQILEGSRS